MSSQKTRHQKLISYWVMNSLVNKPVHTAESSEPVIEIQFQIVMYAL